MTEAVDKHRHANSVEHIWHVWINRRQDARRAAGESWEASLYEWKDALREMERIPIWLKRVREGTLPTIHQQCSFQRPAPITVENKVICALGVNVAECPILKSLYETVAEQAKVPYYENVTADDADALGGKVCAWHIFTEQFGISGHARGHDTSEGYIQDESDRMYWRNVYDSLSGADR